MKAKFHVVFDAEVGSVYSSKEQTWVPGVKRVRAKRMTQSVPDAKSGEITVAFEVDIPDAAFIRLMPEVEVELSNGHWTSMPVRVITLAPDEEE